MAKEVAKPDSESVRISTDAIDIAKQVKAINGTPISRFIVEAIYEKAQRLPKKIREKINFNQ